MLVYKVGKATTFMKIRLIFGFVLVLAVTFGGGCSFNAGLGGGYPVIAVPIESQSAFQAQTMRRYGLGGGSSGSYQPTPMGSYTPTPMGSYQPTPMGTYSPTPTVGRGYGY